MGIGHLELRIEELLKQKGLVKIRFAKNWIFHDRILTDIVEMSFSAWMHNYFASYCIILNVVLKT